MVSKRVSRRVSVLVVLALCSFSASAAQSEPPGPAEQASAESRPLSRTEKIAIGYLRTLWVAQREYQKKNGRYASSLNALVGQGSFTRRMAQPNRGNYTVRFQSGGSSAFTAELVPKEFDAEHPAFFIDETGVVRTEPGQLATAASPEVRTSSP